MYSIRKMATKLNDLCRLCARKHDFLKDLLDESNKQILDLIRKYTQIAISEYENMPTKVCLDCEEKLVSFQLFILECYKVQDSLKLILHDESREFDIKLEESDTDSIDFGVAVKSEVKDELTAEEVVSAINNENAIPQFESGDGFQTYDEDDDDLDNATIASLKEIKDKLDTRKELTDEEAAKLNNVLKKPNLKVKDFVKLDCHICKTQFKSWSALNYHYFKTHKIKAIVFCICGYAIKSKSALYKHVTDHKLESRKLMKISDEEKESNNLNVKDFINFICKTCDKRCSSWYNLKRHCEKLHKIAPVVQCICGITLKSKSVMYKHIQDHKNPSVLSCDQCSIITKSLAALNKHKMKHIPKSERKFQCSSCEKIFNSKDALKSHERSHVPIEERKVYRCEICDLKFTTRSSAASHKRVVHEKIKGYVCDLCGYACGTNGELRQHRAIHSDEKPHTCRKCSKSFKTYSNLKTHMDTHEDTSYVCYVCNRVLNSRRTLRKHLLVHEDKCRHVCSYCNKAFKRRQTLKVHMYTHTGDKPLSCKWCDERFSYASTLRSHRLRCHPDKMAAQAHTSYNPYNHVPMQEQDYIKNDLAAIGVTKNEVEAL